MISAKVSIAEKNTPEFDQLKKYLGKASDAYVTIGVHEDAGSYTEGTSNPKVIEVALWNEFGTDVVPQRSFFRSTVDENEAKIEAMRNKMVENVLFKGWKPEKALEAIGLYVQTLIQNKIKSNVPPAYGTGRNGNSPERIAALQQAKRSKYGHANTLRASELLLRSIRFKVHT